MRLSWYQILLVASLAIFLAGCQSVSRGPVTLTVARTGSGTGTITSSPAGIDCGATCSGSFPRGTSVVLTATPGPGTRFDGWSGACSGQGSCTVTLNESASVTAAFTGPPPVQLSLTIAGAGSGTVTSNPAGLNCTQSCTASFPKGSKVTLTATTASAGFSGWSGACSGKGTCTLTLNAPTAVTATFAATLQSLNHIIFLAQENRSFDHYFGALRQYWGQNGFADQAFDGLPQFNIPAGAAPSNPGCDPAFPYDPTANPPQLNDCIVDSNSPAVTSFHLATQCIENPTPSWNESHVDWNRNDPVNSNATLDGFVQTAANTSRRTSAPPESYTDWQGRRAMGYYDGGELNYYYFMASSFATSDRWFSSVMSRTQPNRMYMIAATSQGHVYPPATGTVLSAKTIFEQLESAGLSWKIYVNSAGTGCADTNSVCLIDFSSIGWFAFGQRMKFDPKLAAHVQSINQYLADAANGTLPNVALIEPAYGAALDEHPTVYASGTPTRIQAGAAYVSKLINTLMNGPSWKDSAFIYTFDEGGGLYDHVPPYTPVPNPDGVPPNDMHPGDICTATPGKPTCDFTYTGYRVPLMVISPFAKKHYVSHTPADLTAILKLIETRFGVPSLTKRDAASMDMTEFFDFATAPWTTPPAPPAQNTNAACSLSPP